MNDISALVFDVFGTVVDWRTSIIHEGVKFNQDYNININWEEFADIWRETYRPNLDKVINKQTPWMNLDTLHKIALEDLLKKFGVNNLTDNEKEHINKIWHRLEPWKDSVEGLNLLKKNFILATMSNGNMSLLVDMAKHSNLSWDCILSGELVQSYKPDKKVYGLASLYLGLPPGKIIMVAAHKSDLLAAQRCGLKTAFVSRPFEFGKNHHVDINSDKSFNFVANDFIDLAAQLHNKVKSEG